MCHEPDLARDTFQHREAAALQLQAQILKPEVQHLRFDIRGSHSRSRSRTRVNRHMLYIRRHAAE